MRHLTILAAIVVAFMCGQAFESRNTNQPSASCTYTYEDTELSTEDLLENFVMDVVDETDFWWECDSTAFSMYEENTTEWYFAVVIEYARWSGQPQKSFVRL